MTTTLRWSWFAGQAIPEGTRNNQLTRIAGGMRRRGAGYDEILRELLGVNRARCKPPLREWEVRTIAKSVSRYRPSLPGSPRAP